MEMPLKNLRARIATPFRRLIRSGSRPAIEWVILALLPLLLSWKWVLLHDHMLSMSGAMMTGDRLVGYIQDLLAWCLLYAVFIGPIRSARRRWSIGALVACNVWLALHLIDIRCKLLFLQPLNWKTFVFAGTQAFTLKSSLGLFAGNTFWMWAIVSQVSLNAVIPLVKLLKRRPFGWPDRPSRSILSTPGATNGCSAYGGRRTPVLVIASVSSLLAVGLWTRPLAYHLDSNVVVAPVVNAVRRLTLDAPSTHSTCDQPVWMLRIDEQASKADPSLAFAKGRNVVMFIVESLRYEDGWFDAVDDHPTPFLRSLSEFGPIATSCYVQVAFSTKAMYSTLTGRYAAGTMEVLESQLPHIEGLATALATAGYHTSFFSTQFLAYQNIRGQYRAMAFDEVLGATELLAMSRADGYEPFMNGYGGDDRMLLHGLVDRLPVDAPFLAVIYNTSSHHPYEFPGSSAAVSDLDRYRQALRFADGVFETLTAQLKHRGLYERTLFLVVGDHGELFIDGKAKGRGCRMTEDEMRVPLIVAAPGADAPRLKVVGARNIDIVRTILDLLGVDPGNLPVQGRTLLDGGVSAPIYMNSWGACSVVGLIEDGTKYLYEIRGRRLWSYDMASDPRQRIPLIVEGDSKTSLVARLEAFNQYNESYLRERIDR